jgi:hypothetical protein
MGKTRRAHRGAGYVQSQQWFDPQVLPPSTLWPTTLTTQPTATMVRPVLPSTFVQTGAGRKARMTRKRGGFYPSIMGPFLANAQAAIVPLALYALYHTLVPKTNTPTMGGKSRKNTRRNSRNRRNSRK